MLVDEGGKEKECRCCEKKRLSFSLKNLHTVPFKGDSPQQSMKNDAFKLKGQIFRRKIEQQREGNTRVFKYQ